MDFWKEEEPQMPGEFREALFQGLDNLDSMPEEERESFIGQTQASCNELIVKEAVSGDTNFAGMLARLLGAGNSVEEGFSRATRLAGALRVHFGRKGSLYLTSTIARIVDLYERPEIGPGVKTLIVWMLDEVFRATDTDYREMAEEMEAELRKREAEGSKDVDEKKEDENAQG